MLSTMCWGVMVAQDEGLDHGSYLGVGQPNLERTPDPWEAGLVLRLHTSLGRPSLRGEEAMGPRAQALGVKEGILTDAWRSS